MAPENALAISAPNAGPPVTCEVSPGGSPWAAAARKLFTASVSAKPDSPVLTGTVAMAALPSAEVISGVVAPGSAFGAACMRSQACSQATRSAEVSADPSARVTTRSIGARSPSGNCRSASAALAESDDGGSCTGD